VRRKNTSGHFGNSFYPPLPVTDVILTVPTEKHVTGARALNGGEVRLLSAENGAALVALDRLTDYECILLTQ